MMWNKNKVYGRRTMGKGRICEWFGFCGLPANNINEIFISFITPDVLFPSCTFYGRKTSDWINPKLFSISISEKPTSTIKMPSRKTNYKRNGKSIKHNPKADTINIKICPDHKTLILNESIFPEIYILC
jgi:hypothetical protein